MRKLKIVVLVLLCIVTMGLCGIFAYGMTGHDIYMRGFGNQYNNIGYGSMNLVLDEEVSLEGVDSISVQYDMNSNDIYIYESEGDFLAVKEYNARELAEDEVSAIKVTGSSLEVRGKRRESYIGFHFFGVGPAGGYTEIGLPSSYKGILTLATSSGDIDSQMDFTLEKDFKAATSSGDIRIPDIIAQNVSLGCSSGRVQVETINAEGSDSDGEINIGTSSGDIDVNQLTGKISVGSSSGDIAVNQLTGETNVESSSGIVRLETVTGNTRISTTSGDITVQRVDGSAKMEASSGDIKIYEGSGNRTAKTTSGDILLEDVNGVWDVEASSGSVQIQASEGSGEICSTSGDITLELGELTGNLDIDSSSGYVRLRLLEDNTFDFEADTSSGKIDTFFDDSLGFSKKGNYAQGTYGNKTGVNHIQVSTTSGDIQVSRQ